MKKQLNIKFESSLSDICNINSSFDSGVLRVCYTGLNRNKTYFTKESIEKSLKTIYNCPVVTNYNREDGTLGGHDIALVKDYKDEYDIVNLTHPVGVVPESAKTWFEFFEEENGNVNEYLCTEVLLWKRQEAYKKIVEDGIEAHSMEITVKDGHVEDGIFHIEDFEFTAFALIGVEPCFEGSALEMFSMDQFKSEFALMMDDFKNNFNTVETSSEVDNTYPQKLSGKGGKTVLDNEEKFSIENEELDNNLEFENENDNASEPENEETFEIESDTVVPEENETTEDENFAEESAEAEVPQVEESTNESFVLTSDLIGELHKKLFDIEQVEIWDGFMDARYCYMDCDTDAGLVYCWDAADDWNIYAFSYTVNGDSVDIDLESKKRMKIAIVEYIDGSSEGYSSDQIFTTNKAYKVLDKKYAEAQDTYNDISSELESLRQFKSDAEQKEHKDALDKLFSKFNDLENNETFESLKVNASDYKLDVIEEKLFALRGRLGTAASSLSDSEEPEVKEPKLPLTNCFSSKDYSNEPYGGLFVEYGIGQSK